jgi:hypothetical protein
MPASRRRIARFLTDSMPIWESESPSPASFYREEFARCQECLREQREFFSPGAVHDVERALVRVLNELDHLCASGDAERVVSQLLRQFDLATGVSNWDAHRPIH